ncbi:dihydrodipicolinate synthase family protein [Rudanella paleaurantiibacter]|uniref:Dihydrodipicolinate synthase family protein n=1 Tax=Rudanella paleaurantiibacter TaxID=2614655 RepID=A0A7J5TSX3_9BACT|nr:dihydrodipicolinate synthase family protein [Rudanella paleaurantiibacter]KAB7726696.1 dihydrodipicolinate synthase family protein [Rudanella paleaurantiibacter]
MSLLNNARTPLPRGFIPVMLTPFRESGAIDTPGLAHLTDFYLESGAAGLFANCLSSEMYELTDSERLSVTRQVVSQVAGRVPVVATGTLGGSMEQQTDFVRRIYDTGVQAVIVITSQLVMPDESDAVFLDRMHQLMDLTGAIPLGLYECPVPYKRLINSTILADLLSTGRLIYHKDTSLDADEVARRLRVAEGYEFGLYDAYMVNAVSSLRAGAAGLSCIQGNHFPELIVWLCRHYDDPSRWEQAARVQQFLTDCMALVHTAYPIIAKYSLQKRGLPISLHTRRTVDPFTPSVRNDMDALLSKVERLYEELGIESVQPQLFPL